MKKSIANKKESCHFLSYLTIVERPNFLSGRSKKTRNIGKHIKIGRHKAVAIIKENLLVCVYIYSTFHAFNDLEFVALP